MLIWKGWTRIRFDLANGQWKMLKSKSWIYRKNRFSHHPVFQIVKNGKRQEISPDELNDKLVFVVITMSKKVNGKGNRLVVRVYLGADDNDNKESKCLLLVSDKSTKMAKLLKTWRVGRDKFYFYIQF